ncbi:MAG: calcium/sodium antiporter [Magnetococcales bacterium]|nr:calcium/sodium antiporter [Magnetococcales bacterium]
MMTAWLAVAVGLMLLVWSAERFVEGAAATAHHFGMPSLLIGMLVFGFGTSAPEMVVSALSALQGNPGIALGNAYGSNIANVALILGLTALLRPITVHSQVLRRELPILTAMTALAYGQALDGVISHTDAMGLFAVFGMLMIWTIWQGLQPSDDPLGGDALQEMEDHAMTVRQALLWVVAGLILLIISSRLLVWGAVDIAQSLGVSDLVIGLTIVAIGTSLPELAASVVAVRKGEHDLVLGNVIGSNLFNTAFVVGIAGAIHPVTVTAEVLSRDMLVMAALTVSLFIIGYGFRGGPGRVNRLEGGVLLMVYVGYMVYLTSVSL